MPSIDVDDRSGGASLEALLAFWADAGVDVCLSENPVDRLAEGARKLAPAPRPPAQAPVGPFNLPASDRAGFNP